MFDSIVLTKTLTALAYPAGLLLVLTVMNKLFVWSRRIALANACKHAFWLILILSTNPVFATWLVSGLEQQYRQVPIAEITQHDAIIVLGGGLKVPLPPTTRSQLARASDRYWYAAELYKAGKADKIFIAGGNVFEQRDQNGYELPGEAFYARQLLIDWGVNESDLVIEDKSRTTQQNRANIAGLLTQHQVKTALLVTSSIHMPRSFKLFSDIELFRSGDLKLTPAPADLIVTRASLPSLMQWLPSANALSMTTQALHEYYGLIVLYAIGFLEQD